MKKYQLIVFILLAISSQIVAQFDISYSYGTYLGRSNIDLARGIECNENEKCFLYGSTASVNFYNDEAFQEDFAGGQVDGFYSLFSDDGELEYSSFFGGSGNESIFSMDQKNGYYALTGFTQSSDFPVTSGSHKEELSGDQDIFVALFTDSHELIWSTFFGGEQNEDNPKIALDEELNVYLSGETGSSDLGTPGVHQENLMSTEFSSTFLAKFNLSGDLVWCTYFQGNSISNTKDLDILENGEHIGLVGETFADTGIAFDGYQNEYAGEGDAYIASFNTSNGTLAWSSYFGGEGTDFLYDLEVTELGYLICGQTASAENIASDNAHQIEKQGFSDGYITSFDFDGNLNWATYFGGESYETAFSLSSVANTLIVLGATDSDNNIAFGNPLEAQNNSDESYGAKYLASFNLASGTINWGTYFFSDCRNLSPSWHHSFENGKIVLGGRVSNIGSCEEWATDDAFQTFYGGGDEDAALLFCENNSLSTNFLKTEDIEVWPNPVIDVLNFNLDKRVELTIINTVGQEVMSLELESSTNQINLRSLNPGLYILYFEAGSTLYKSNLLKL